MAVSIKPSTNPMREFAISLHITLQRTSHHRGEFPLVYMLIGVKF